VYLPNESQCTYVIEQKVAGFWWTYFTNQVINYRLGEPDLCFNGLSLDGAGRCPGKTIGPPGCGGPPPLSPTGPGCGSGGDAATGTGGSNPVNGATANKYQWEEDYRGPGPYPLVFERHYNSITRTPGSLGSNWRSSFDRFLSVSDNGVTVTAFRADGRSYDFTLSGNTGTPPADIAETLIRQADGSWRLIRSNGDEVESYDSRGRLTAITHRSGLSLRLSYDGSNRLASVTDSYGRAVAFGYDAGNRIATVTDPASHAIRFGYDGNNNLTTVTYPDDDANPANDPERTYLYNEPAYTAGASLPHALTGIRDEGGKRFATFQYDATGRAVSSEHAGGAGKVSFVYNADGTTTVTDSAGSAGTGTARSFKPCWACAGRFPSAVGSATTAADRPNL
jgi:YD repeat-containing protein